MSTTVPDATGHFGPYGGRFVPETLMAPLDELERAYLAAREEPAFRTELEELAARLPALRIVHVISRPSGAWQGYQGHIDREVLNRELADPGGWRCFVSGPPPFTTAMANDLRAWGVPPTSITMELFAGYEQ